MAEVMPINFPLPADKAVANYNWVDLVQNLGYFAFYPCGASESPAGSVYFLTQNESPSDNNNTTLTTGGTTAADFDISVNSSFYVPATYGYVEYSTNINNGSLGTVFTIYHVTSGGSATSLGTVNGGSISTASNLYYKKSARISLSAHRFVKGDKLRINITISGANGTLYFDPSGRRTASETGTGATIALTTKVFVPILIEV